jgi:uncharacterized membrane-anchored protein
MEVSMYPCSRWLPFVALLTVASFGSNALAQSDTPAFPDREEGPTTAHLGAQAIITIPEGYVFLGPKGAARFMELTQNIPSGKEAGIIFKKADDENWFAVFEYVDAGHVDDSDRSDLDPAGLLKTLKAGNERGNEMRKERGWQELQLVGWFKPPYYDTGTNNLTWATTIQVEKEQTVNHSVRLLGREGYFNADLVVGTESAAAATADFAQLLTGFEYVAGQRYAEFRRGDRVAELGLVALVAGGAGAAAAKSGLLAKAWKGIVVAVLGLFAFLKRVVGGVLGRKQEQEQTA